MAFGLLAALILVFSWPTTGVFLFVVTPLDAGLGVLALPRTGALAAAPFAAAGMGFLVGAPVFAVTGFLVPTAEVLALFLGVGAGRAFCPVFGAPRGLAPWDLTCLVAAADGLGCADAGRIFLEAFVT